MAEPSQLGFESVVDAYFNNTRGTSSRSRVFFSQSNVGAMFLSVLHIRIVGLRRTILFKDKSSTCSRNWRNSNFDLKFSSFRTSSCGRLCANLLSSFSFRPSLSSSQSNVGAMLFSTLQERMDGARRIIFFKADPLSCSLNWRFANFGYILRSRVCYVRHVKRY